MITGKSLLASMTSALALMAASTAFATTATFDFTTINSGTQSSLFYSVNGIDLTLSTTGGNGNIQTWAGYGLGAPGDSHHQVDSYGIPEIINFAFNTAVKITGITFNSNYVHAWDDFQLFENGVSQGVQDVQPSVSLTTGTADNFGVGAYGSSTFWTGSALHRNSAYACYNQGYSQYRSQYSETCYSAFKITGVTVENTPSSVPLPAGVFLLGGALGGLGLFRRRRKTH